MARTKGKHEEPSLVVPPACLRELKPLLYQLALLKARKASLREVRKWTSDNIMPVWRSYNLHEPHLHPNLYPQSVTKAKAEHVASLYCIPLSHQLMLL